MSPRNPLQKKRRSEGAPKLTTESKCSDRHLADQGHSIRELMQQLYAGVQLYGRVLVFLFVGVLLVSLLGN